MLIISIFILFFLSVIIRQPEFLGFGRRGIVFSTAVQSLRIQPDVLDGKIPRKHILLSVAIQFHHRLAIVGRYLRLVQEFVHHLVLVGGKLRDICRFIAG